MLCNCSALRRDDWSDVSDYESVDFFSDQSLIEDPYPYFDHLRSQCPILPTGDLGVVAVSGYEAAMEIYLDPETFSSCNAVVGPFASFSVPLGGGRHQWHHRPPPGRTAAERSHDHHGPSHAHAGASAGHAPPHAETPQGERGVHVGTGRSADGRVRRDRPLRVHQCVYAAIRHARRGRRARGTRIRPPALP